MYADTMPGEIAAWVERHKGACYAQECCGNGQWNGDPDDPPQCCCQPDYVWVGTPVDAALLDYATGLLEAALPVIAADDKRTAYHQAHRDDAWDNDSDRQSARASVYRTQIAALHAALVAQGLIGGKS